MGFGGVGDAGGGLAGEPARAEMRAPPLAGPV